MNSVIVCSQNDPAGTNIRDRLLEKFPFKETNDVFDSSPVYAWSDKLLVSSLRDIVFVDNLDEKFNDVKYIFISRHRAESGIPSLTAHFIGNFGPASFGGNAGQVGKYSPSLLKNYLKKLNSFRDEIPSSYTITMEATHHGPSSLMYPVLFVELGSSEKEWGDAVAGSIVARALVSSLEMTTKYEKCAIGIGGTHYPEKLNRQLLDTDMAIGPIVPKYSLEYFDKALLAQILDKSDQKINFALVDSKGLGKFKEKVMDTLSGFDLEIVKV